MSSYGRQTIIIEEKRQFLSGEEGGTFFQKNIFLTKEIKGGIS